MFILAFALACAPERSPEDPSDWFTPGDALEVTEPVAFTDADYGFSGGIGDLKSSVYPTPNDGLVYDPDDNYPTGACTALTDTQLPAEITGIVTVTPRFYFKTVGCNDDEKYYGSFFIQDDDGALFVLGDTKAAHFGLGDKVTIRVRGAKTRYDLDMVYAWDIVHAEHTAQPIHYDVATAPFGTADISAVRRVEGEVISDADTFGAFQIQGDNGTIWSVQLDSELNRRGVHYEIGERIQATGPVLFSYSLYTVVVLSIGQITRLDP